MITYNQIDKLFGTPLNVVPKPQVPFQMQTWHWVVGGIVVGLVGYGAYSLYRDTKKLTGKKETPAEVLLNRGVISGLPA